MEIAHVNDGPELIAWTIAHYPESASMALCICLDFETGDIGSILGRCPIGYYLKDPAWRTYYATAVIEHWGKAGGQTVYGYYTRYQDPNYPDVILSHLYGWRFIAALHSDWIPAWTPEWETYYAALYDTCRRN